MYKQVIIVNKELNMSKGKMAAQVSHASMAFLTRMIQRNTKKIEMYAHRAWYIDKNGNKIPQLYKRNDLDIWAREARIRGEDVFYARPKDANAPYGELELCEPSHCYECHMEINKDIYEQWMGGMFTKVILEAKDEAHMKKIVEKAHENGMLEDVDFHCIRDNCLTELTPDETGTRWTCIGFAPMEVEKIDVITKRLQLYKG